MSDVADMLGIQARPTISAAEEAAKILDRSAKKTPKGPKKPKGMKREVYDLLGDDAILPAVQSSSTPAFKSKRQMIYGKWLWAPIESSARNDNPNPIFFHWVKADMHYSDYPYARYNIQLDRLTYTDEEYNTLLKDDAWSREDTDQLVDLCATYALRWPVIHDRIQLSSPKAVEDLIARYYSISSLLSGANNNADKSLPVQGISVHDRKAAAFDVEKESRRRKQQDILFRRTKEDEQEEIRIKEEIKAIDAILKKNKKAVKSLSAANCSVNLPPPAPPVSTSNVNSSSNQESKAMNIGDGSHPSNAPTTLTANLEGKEILPPPTLANPSLETYIGPQRNKPCLQSTRLYLTDNNLQLSKSLMGKMKSYLTELNIPERPIPTKRICDLVDQIRKSTVSLISLHNNIKKKEKEISILKNGPVKGATKTSTKKDANKADKPVRQRAPAKPRNKAAGASTQPPVPGSTSTAPSATGPLNESNLSADLSPASTSVLLPPASSMDKAEVDLLDFDRHESFLDDPLDPFVIDGKKEGDGHAPAVDNSNPVAAAAAPGATTTKTNKRSRESNGGTTQPRKRNKKNQP